MSTNGYRDKGSYPYDDPPVKKRRVPQLRDAAEREQIITGLVMMAVAFVFGFSFGYAVGVLHG